MHFDWWTLALQAVNVLVLIWILGRFLFRPVMEIIARRQDEANKQLLTAAAERKSAEDARAEAERANADFAAEREVMIDESRKAARSEGERLLEGISQEIAKRRSETDAAIARDRAAAEQSLVAHASELAVDIAQRLLERLPIGLSLNVFLEGLCRELRALTPEARAILAGATRDHPIEVLSASPLADEDMLRLRRALAEALDTEVPIVFREEPALLAGLELRGSSLIVRNSWQADLERIRGELKRSDEPRPS
jgi:F-type H+-transporting ATPase subunit b